MRDKEDRVLRRLHESRDRAQLRLLTESSEYSPEDLAMRRRIEAEKAARKEFNKPFKKHKIVIPPEASIPGLAGRQARVHVQEGVVPIQKPSGQRRLGLTYRKQGVHKSPGEYIREAGGFHDETTSCAAMASVKRFLNRGQGNAYRPNSKDTLPQFAVTLEYERHERGQDQDPQTTKSGKGASKSRGTKATNAGPTTRPQKPYDPDEDDDHLNEDLPDLAALFTSKKGSWTTIH